MLQRSRQLKRVCKLSRLTVHCRRAVIATATALPRGRFAIELRAKMAVPSVWSERLLFAKRDGLSKARKATLQWRLNLCRGHLQVLLGYGPMCRPAITATGQGHTTAGQNER